MLKSKPNQEEYLEDLNKILEIISNLDNENISLKDISKLSKKVKIINKEIKNKYKDLDVQE
tara:strand:- start:2341 stop:2523 length:183 start_codon:yes stop_codon:yes gene_type:complete